MVNVHILHAMADISCQYIDRVMFPDTSALSLHPWLPHCKKKSQIHESFSARTMSTLSASPV